MSQKPTPTENTGEVRCLRHIRPININVEKMVETETQEDPTVDLDLHLRCKHFMKSRCASGDWCKRLHIYPSEDRVQCRYGDDCWYQDDCWFAHGNNIKKPNHHTDEPKEYMETPMAIVLRRKLDEKSSRWSTKIQRM